MNDEILDRSGRRVHLPRQAILSSWLRGERTGRKEKERTGGRKKKKDKTTADFFFFSLCLSDHGPLPTRNALCAVNMFRQEPAFHRN